MQWWQEFFDETYRQLWSHLHPPEECATEAINLVHVLGLQPGMRLLDAPCGYGRLSLPLARLGLAVTGVDYSGELLASATQAGTRAGLAKLLEFVQADLRNPLKLGEFDAVINMFSSIGYGTEEDDLRTLSTLFRALAPKGQLYLETTHRDSVVTRLARGETTGIRGPNGMTLREKNRFNPVTSMLRSTWTWNSPTNSGSRHSEIRLYSATELVSLLRRAGFHEIECRVGVSDVDFDECNLGERLGLRAVKA